LRVPDAGHILGSAILEIRLDVDGGEARLVFSGDLGQPGRPIVRDARRVEEADVLLVESTYPRPPDSRSPRAQAAPASTSLRRWRNQ
jgi:Cft2 family RNA processing exonuclease